MSNKIRTREEFSEHLKLSSDELSKDKKLSNDAVDLISRADQYNWIHQTSWLGEPILNIPQDLFALQEIIFETRPDFIIELGVAWGGSLLFYSSLMEILGGKKIIGIDIYVPNDLKERISRIEKLSSRIEWIEGSTIDCKTIEKVESIVSDSKKIMVIIDSNHSHNHVSKELQLYERFVGKGNYMICCSTIIEKIPMQNHRPREWGPGNNPMTAVTKFLNISDKFIVDELREKKMLLSCHPRGYLRAIKD